MDVPQDFSSLQDQIQAALIAATRTVGQISNEDLGFQRSLDASVGEALDEQSARLLALSTSLLRSAASISQIRVPLLEDAEDVDNNWQGVVDVVDSLLEKADTCLDEYTGVIKRQSPSAPEEVSMTNSSCWILAKYIIVVIIKDQENSVPWQLFQDSKYREASTGISKQARQHQYHSLEALTQIQTSRRRTA
jgi:hypothetical protein